MFAYENGTTVLLSDKIPKRKEIIRSREQRLKSLVSWKSLPEPSEADQKILYVGRSHTNKFFTLGKTDGFELIPIEDSSSGCGTQSELLSRDYSRASSSTSLDFPKMSFRTNREVLIVRAMKDMDTFGLVMKDEPKSILLWNRNDLIEKNWIDFESRIIDILFNNDFLVVILRWKTYVFRLPSLSWVDQIVTCNNAKGLGAISTGDKPKNKIIACPHPNLGEIMLHFYGMGEVVDHVIPAHFSELSALDVNPSGTLIASASRKGTLIRIFSADGGNWLQELRRGTSEATIYDLIFHPEKNILACNSSQGTIHLFDIKESISKLVKSNDYGCSKSIMK